jgi:hypothetical protein
MGCGICEQADVIALFLFILKNERSLSLLISLSSEKVETWLKTAKEGQVLELGQSSPYRRKLLYQTLLQRFGNMKCNA